MLHSQQLKEILLATTKNSITGRAVKFCRREPAGEPGLFMNTYYVVRSSRPAGLFSFGFLDGLPVRLRRPHLREAQAGFGLERLATAFMNNPG
jgi:hypothetical protein